MTQVLDSLIQEHTLILQMLASLSQSIKRLEKGEQVGLDIFKKSIDFFHNFTEKYHHRKEEDILFELMYKRINSSHNGLLQMLEKEHKLGRFFMTKFEDAVARLERGDESAPADIVEFGRKFSLLFAHHIHKEDTILYELVNNTLSEKEKNYLAAELDKKNAILGAKRHQKFRGMAGEPAPTEKTGLN